MKIEQHKDQTRRPMTTVLRRLLVFCAILVGAGLASAQAPLQKHQRQHVEHRHALD